MKQKKSGEVVTAVTHNSVAIQSTKSQSDMDLERGEFEFHDVATGLYRFVENNENETSTKVNEGESNKGEASNASEEVTIEVSDIGDNAGSESTNVEGCVDNVRNANYVDGQSDHVNKDGGLNDRLDRLRSPVQNELESARGVYKDGYEALYAAECGSVQA
ncbi:hypothetical protein PsorP6_009130 [Peronosclerospora sorghi]|uniref:Uncharacterized protein n=1 Tax=Peronosclerospora sorghi TaxID=230839 RepID=A0ACC0W0K5_9STRA|nr:hypothetical protein PsorP6_009130 [Peronosclerospora sorghi]